MLDSLPPLVDVISSGPAGEVEITFSAWVETEFGSDVRIVGSAVELGGWQPAGGLSLQTRPGEYPRWSAVMRLPAAAFEQGAVEYKVCVVHAEGHMVWQEGPNHVLPLKTYQAGLNSMPQHKEATLKVMWEVSCAETSVGDRLFVVGPTPALGGWTPTSGLHLSTSHEAFPVWRGHACLSARHHPFVWKLALVGADGQVRWEAVDDRQCILPRWGDHEDQAQTWMVRATFGGKCEVPSPYIGDVAMDFDSTGCGNDAAHFRAVRAEAGPKPQRIVFALPEDQRPDADGDSPKVEVLFDAESTPWQLDFDSAEQVWVLETHGLGLGTGVHTFTFRVNGETKLSPLHTVVGTSNAIFLSEALWEHVHSVRTGPRSSLRLLHESRRASTPRQKVQDAGDLRKCRPKRTSCGGSSASTTASESDGGSEDSLTTGCSDFASGFPDSIYENLYSQDLRVWLDGHVLPESRPTPPLCFWSGVHRIQKPGGRCEDAYFHGSCSIGVADGVGSMAQYAQYGCDAAAYACELMEKASAALESANQPKNCSVDQRAAGAIATAEQTATTFGASTIAVAALEGSSIGVANLGDSGVMLLRKTTHGMAIIARTKEQQHSWNCPYQLVRLPSSLQVRVRSGGQTGAAACGMYQFEALPGDLLLAYTDGMADNLHESEILEIVDRALGPAWGALAGCAKYTTSPEILARSLAQAAWTRSRDPEALVPFNEASRQHGQNFLGGKTDDITVVAAWVLPEELRC